jgi:hypothetical protein
VELILSGTYQSLTYVDDVYPLGDNIDIIKEDTEASIDASKEVGLEVNAEKTKYVFMLHYQNAGQNYNM